MPSLPTRVEIFQCLDVYIRSFACIFIYHHLPKVSLLVYIVLAIVILCANVDERVHINTFAALWHVMSLCAAIIVFYWFAEVREKSQNIYSINEVNLDNDELL